MPTCPNCSHRLSTYRELWTAEVVETSHCEHCGWEVSYTVHPDRSTHDHPADDGSPTTAEDPDS